MKGLMDIPILRNFINEQVAEGSAKGRVEGRVEAVVDTLMDTLAVRFGAAPDDLRARVAAIGDETRLIDLHRFAVTCPDLDAFRARLANLGVDPSQAP